MKLNTFIYLTSFIMLFSAFNNFAYAVTSTIPTDSNSVMLSGGTPQSPTIAPTGGSVPQFYSPTDTQAFGTICSTGLMTGATENAGNFETHTMANGVNVGWAWANYNNYSITMMTTGGSRLIYCQGVNLGYH